MKSYIFCVFKNFLVSICDKLYVHQGLHRGRGYTYSPKPLWLAMAIEYNISMLWLTCISRGFKLRSLRLWLNCIIMADQLRGMIIMTAKKKKNNNKNKISALHLSAQL